jgi:hypothetical protein
VVSYLPIYLITLLMEGSTYISLLMGTGFIISLIPTKDQLHRVCAGWVVQL